MKKTWQFFLVLALVLLSVVGCNQPNPSNPVNNSWDSGKWDVSSWQ